jgi:hypothetical protein
MVKRALFYWPSPGVTFRRWCKAGEPGAAWFRKIALAGNANWYFFGWFIALFQHFISPLGELLFFACTKKM